MMGLQKERFDVVVIGGGPAGLLAAGKAASLGASVMLLESMEKPARKLRISGKGRCNITNTKPIDEFMEEIHPEPRFLRNAFTEFFNQDIVNLLHENGLQTIEERGQRIFPKSGKAWDVAETLVKWARKCSATILCKSRVTSIVADNNTITAVTYSSKGNGAGTISCNSVVIATGGKSYPATGSTGDGYKLAAACGHTITELMPTLVGIETEPTLQADALSLRNVTLSLFNLNKKIAQEFGELEITPYGLSGPIVLKLSRRIGTLLQQGATPVLLLDLKPALTPEKLDARLQREAENLSREPIRALLRKLMPKQLISPFADQAGIALQKPVSRLTASERKSIINSLKELRFSVTSYRDWPEAIATAGGVSLKEVDPRSMESKLVKGLYFAGEVLDLDGATGGYNLQIAFSTGWLAGKSCAE